MAKWGEGDPRWIVEERPDATNVNNWHWTEKNASPWSTDKLKELLEDLKIEHADVYALRIVKIDRITGEASANNRKGKLIFFYEWDISLKWEGRIDESDKVVEGLVKIPNLSEENDPSEIDINVDFEGKMTKQSDRLKEIMYQTGRDIIRQQLIKYITCLKEEFSKGMILPRKDGQMIGEKECINNLTCGFNKKLAVNNAAPASKVERVSSKSGEKISTSTITNSIKLVCQASDAFNAFLRMEMAQMWTQGAVNKLDSRVEGEFALFNNNITGKFIEIVPLTKIVQLWRYSQWPSGHYSTVRLEIEEKDDHTIVNLTQTGVPNSDIDTTRNNWDRYYWEPIKRTFGWGAYFDT